MTHAMGLTVRKGLGALLLWAATQAAWAQSSPSRTVTVPFAAATSSDGYAQASMVMTYAFIACQGEIHIAYSLNEGSATVGNTYMLGGKSYPVSGAPPQPGSIHFSGTVYRGPSPVGSFSDGLAGRSLGMGCFSGQSQQIASIASAVGPNATPAQVTAYLDSLSVQVRPGEVLRSAAQESLIRSGLRRAEAEAAAEARRVEQAALAQAQQERDQRAAAERQAQDARNAQAQASTASTASMGAGASMPSMPSSVPAAPLTREQRIANAIASDKVLADQRMAEQRAKFAQQQQAMADAQQRQNEALIAAAPAALELAGSIYGALEAWDAGIKSRAYQKAQAQLAGTCRLANGLAAPKDGTIQLGVELTADLSKHDCGDRPSMRFKGFKLELAEPTRLQFTIKAAKWRHLVEYQINVSDLDAHSHMFMGWQEWGAIQKVNSKNVTLPAGIYIVEVSNGTEDIFAGFDLRVDAMSEDWTAPLAATPAPPAPAPAPPSNPIAAAMQAGSTAVTTAAPAMTPATPPTAAAGAIDVRWGLLAELAERDFHYGDLFGDRSLTAFRWEVPGQRLVQIDTSALYFLKRVYTLDPATGEIVLMPPGIDDPQHAVRLTALEDGRLRITGETRKDFVARKEGGRYLVGGFSLVPNTATTPSARRAEKLIADGKLRAPDPALRRPAQAVPTSQ